MRHKNCVLRWDGTETHPVPFHELYRFSNRLNATIIVVTAEGFRRIFKQEPDESDEQKGLIVDHAVDDGGDGSTSYIKDVDTVSRTRSDHQERSTGTASFPVLSRRGRRRGQRASVCERWKRTTRTPLDAWGESKIKTTYQKRSSNKDQHTKRTNCLPSIPRACRLQTQYSHDLAILVPASFRICSWNNEILCV